MISVALSPPNAFAKKYKYLTFYEENVVSHRNCYKDAAVWFILTVVLHVAMQFWFLTGSKDLHVFMIYWFGSGSFLNFYFFYPNIYPTITNDLLMIFSL